MARTIRRKSGEQWYKPYSVQGYTEEELAVKKRRFHMDLYYSWNSPSPWFRNMVERQHRMSTKTQLAKFYKDLDYEIQLKNKPQMPYWD
jgi:hypothetical protein